jgi:hypothetical protein
MLVLVPVWLSCLFLVAAAVPVVPNLSKVQGLVLEYAMLDSKLEGVEPSQILYSLRILVYAVADVGSFPNFLTNQIGKVMRLLSGVPLSPCLFRQRIEVDVQLLGDEWGRRLWLVPGTLIDLSAGSQGETPCQETSSASVQEGCEE